MISVRRPFRRLAAACVAATLSLAWIIAAHVA